MTRIANKALLRSVYRKLGAVPFDRSDAGHRLDAAQDRLDFLAMLAGLKPVFLLGRGFDDPQWVGGVLRIAADLALRAVEGPYWDANLEEEGLPAWFATRLREGLSGCRAYYVARARSVADEAAEVCENGRPTPAQEARLLGYPECCVLAHYERSRRYRATWLGMLERAAAGDETEMRRLLRSGAPLEPESGAAQAALADALAATPAPHTSVDMCEDCQASPDSPAMRLSRRYAALAKAVDPGFAAAGPAPSATSRLRRRAAPARPRY